MIDADHFKSYNDRFGHQAGDELLAALAQVSIGVACIVPAVRTIAQDLIGAADHALFAAKQGGRNCVVAAVPIACAMPRLVA